jgi:hypothetical protein
MVKLRITDKVAQVVNEFRMKPARVCRDGAIIPSEFPSCVNLGRGSQMPSLSGIAAFVVNGSSSRVVSRDHGMFSIEQDGQIYFTDTSKNGTVVGVLFPNGESHYGCCSNSERQKLSFGEYDFFLGTKSISNPQNEGYPLEVEVLEESLN